MRAWLTVQLLGALKASTRRKGWLAGRTLVAHTRTMSARVGEGTGWLVLPALCWAMLACGSSVTVAPGGGGTSGGGGVAGSPTGGGVGGTGATGASGGTGGGTIACGRTNDYARFALTTWDGQQWGCDFGTDTETGLLELQAAVVSSASSSLTLDSCPPNAFCEPELNELSVEAPGLELNIPLGTYVELRAAAEFPWACWHQLVIVNLPEWGGEPNPTGPGRRMWLGLSDGEPTAPPDAPFDVNEEPLGCYGPDEPACGRPADDFALAFRSPIDPASALRVGMGETVSWELEAPVGPIHWVVRNLRSYESGACDDHWNWAYWITPALVWNGP